MFCIILDMLTGMTHPIWWLLTANSSFCQVLVPNTKSVCISIFKELLKKVSHMTLRKKRVNLILNIKPELDR